MKLTQRCLWGFLSLLLSAPAARPQATYRLYRANLHAHTAFSDGGNSISSYPSERDPGTAAEYAHYLTDLDVFATSDHGEYLTADLWARTQSLLLGATAPGRFVALRGFEWTQTTDTAFVYNVSGGGHIGVYGSDLRTGAADFTGVGGFGPGELSPSLWWTTYGTSATTAGSLYQWILDHGQSAAFGGSIICQFNHPSLYPRASLANPSRQYASSLSYEWYRKLEYIPQLDPYFDLMEMGSRTLDTSTIPGYQNGDANEAFYQLALDNGWHVAPTNSEDNHADHYGDLVTSTRSNPATSGILSATGIWSEPTDGLSPAAAQRAILAALRSRRTYAVEDKAATHAASLSIRWTFNTPSGVKWMGAKGLVPADVSASRCHLEISRAAGLQLSRVEVVANRGVVAKALPVSGAGVTVNGNTASWDFGLPADTPAAQVRTFNATAPSNPVFNTPPLPPAIGASPMTVGLDASSSGRVERYYYVRVRQADGTLAYSAPVWLARTAQPIVSTVWDFGDGSPLQVVVASQSGVGSFPGVTHTYAAPGVYYPRAVLNYSGGGRDVAFGRVVTDGSGAPFYGDVNGDGQVNGDDVACLTRIAAGMSSCAGPDQFRRADIAPSPGGRGLEPGDGHLGLPDVTCLARYLAEGRKLTTSKR